MMAVSVICLLFPLTALVCPEGGGKLVKNKGRKDPERDKPTDKRKEEGDSEERHGGSCPG